MNAPAERGLVEAFAQGDGQSHRVLLPGEWWFGFDALTVSTLLGSCVAVVLWHPQRRLAGMCHYLVPNRARQARDPLDGRYGDEALSLLRQAVIAAGSMPTEYRTLVFGGANMFSEVPRVTFDIGARNAEVALDGLVRHGFIVAGSDVGGTKHRRIELEVATGRVRVRAGSA